MPEAVVNLGGVVDEGGLSVAQVVAQLQSPGSADSQHHVIVGQGQDVVASPQDQSCGFGFHL